MSSTESSRSRTCNAFSIFLIDLWNAIHGDNLSFMPPLGGPTTKKKKKKKSFVDGFFLDDFI
jgi:hypothetical protein